MKTSNNGDGEVGKVGNECAGDEGGVLEDFGNNQEADGDSSFFDNQWFFGCCSTCDTHMLLGRELDLLWEVCESRTR